MNVVYTSALMMANAADDQMLVYLLVIFGVVAALIIKLYNGRRPLDVALAGYPDHSLDNLQQGVNAIAEIKASLQDEDYRRAHDIILAHNNWFFARKHALPPVFTNQWFLIRTRVYRMATMDVWRKEWIWAEDSLKKMRIETLQQVENTIAMFMDFCEVPLDDEDQFSSREMEAPSEASLLSMHS